MANDVGLACLSFVEKVRDDDVVEDDRDFNVVLVTLLDRSDVEERYVAVANNAILYL